MLAETQVKGWSKMLTGDRPQPHAGQLAYVLRFSSTKKNAGCRGRARETEAGEAGVSSPPNGRGQSALSRVALAHLSFNVI